MSVNKVILIGNLGSDPDSRTTASSKQVTSFSMATSEQFKDNATGERKSLTEWHNIVLWGNVAEIASKYLKKGSKIYLEGRIKTRSYDDKQGVKKYITEIIGDKITMLGEKPAASQEPVLEASGKELVEVGNDTDDLLF